MTPAGQSTVEASADTVSADWAAARSAARWHGFAAGLRRLAEMLPDDVLPCGPRGHAVVDVDRYERAGWIQLGGTVVRRDRSRETRLAAAGLDAELVAMRHPVDGAIAPTNDATAGTADPLWSAGLAWLRLGQSEALLQACLTYLAHRHSGGVLLLDLPVVQLDVATAQVALVELDGLLPHGTGGTGGAGDHALRVLHRRVTATDRALLRLHGAHGFLSDGPGRQTQVSELAAHVYVPAPDW
jgi:hypothetical protein